MSQKMIPMSVISNYYTPRLTGFLTGLAGIAQTINIVEMVTPINASQEKATWLKEAQSGNWTNPSFQYDTELLAKIAGLKSSLSTLGGVLKPTLETLSKEPAGQALSELVCARYKEIESSILLAQHILLNQDADTAKDVRTIFDSPSKEIVKMAEEFAEALAKKSPKVQRDDINLAVIRDKLKELEFDSGEIREHFIWMAARCGFAGTRPVSISERATSIDVRDKSSWGPVVVIPKDRRVNGLKLVELAGHEIFCHWGDSERAARVLPMLGSGALKPTDETLYEGHATLTDYYTHYNLGDKVSRMNLPFYILAMEQAIQGATFAQTAAHLHEVVQLCQLDEEAVSLVWKTCLRVFRGSSGGCNNGTQRYAFTKDRAYFEGRIMAEKLHAEKLDSILEISTLSGRDIQILQTAVEFERKDSDQAKAMICMWNLVQRLLEYKL